MTGTTAITIRRCFKFAVLVLASIKAREIILKFGKDDHSFGSAADNDYGLALKESLGFFNDIPAYQWKMHQSWARQNKQQLFYPHAPEQGQENPAYWYALNYFPTFSCPTTRRILGLGDGPKFMCDPHRLTQQAERRKAAGESGPHCIVYSIGSFGNYDFEDGLVQFLGHTMCQFHIFDFSGDFERPQNQEKNMYFHKLGLQGSHEDRGPEFKTFQEITRLLGHENKTIDVFKIDCEGCEWSTYQDWVQHDIGQVLVETHGLGGTYLDYFAAFAKNNFAMFSREANTMTGGQAYEWSYIKLHPDFFDDENEQQPVAAAAASSV